MGEYILTLSAGEIGVTGGTLHASQITGVLGAILTCDTIVASVGPIVFEGDISVASPAEDQRLAIDGDVQLMANGALYNKSYNDPILQISGSLTNDGVVRSGPGYAAYGSNSLTIELAGDLAQNGSYTPLATYFTGSAWQMLSVGAEQVLTGTFTDTTPSSPLIAGSDLLIQGATFDLGVDSGTAGLFDMGEFTLTHTDGALSIQGGTLEVDEIIGSTDNNNAIFSLATVQPPSGSLTVRERFPTASMDVVGSLILPTGSVLFNAYDVTADVTVSGTISGSGIVGSGQGYASYDDGALFLNGLEQADW
jgi:hypothetical protein